LLKDEDPEVVCQAVSEVHQNGLFFRDYVSKALLKGSKARAGAAGSLFGPKLSEREIEVLTLLCQEKTSKEIGDALFISARTVEGHRRSLQEKIGAKNLAGLVMYAVKQGIV
ncbi:MAG: response regulator transcription factor, partial [Bacteroidota bacterium]